jgi:F-type H+-transporting ATPase subunit b
MLESLNLSQMITVVINLVILYLFMRKFLFKPVTAYMENRSNGIRESMDAADKAQADALELKQQYEEQLKAARTEAARLMDEAREKAGREYEKLSAEAKKDAEDILAKAREAIGRERAEMLREVKNQVAGLALAAASKVIGANMDTEKNRVLVDKFIEEEGVA